jgi:hypothetical protein
MYDEKQTLFRLAMSSQLGASFRGNVGDLESQTAVALKAELDRAAPDMGDWKVVWGPAIYYLSVSLLVLQQPRIETESC